jgi:hypothetical protein
LPYNGKGPTAWPSQTVTSLTAKNPSRQPSPFGHACMMIWMKLVMVFRASQFHIGTTAASGPIGEGLRGNHIAIPYQGKGGDAI